jgi:hypothetical protein
MGRGNQLKSSVVDQMGYKCHSMVVTILRRPIASFTNFFVAIKYGALLLVLNRRIAPSNATPAPFPPHIRIRRPSIHSRACCAALHSKATHDALHVGGTIFTAFSGTCKCVQKFPFVLSARV